MSCDQMFATHIIHLSTHTNAHDTTFIVWGVQLKSSRMFRSANCTRLVRLAPCSVSLPSGVLARLHSAAPAWRSSLWSLGRCSCRSGPYCPKTLVSRSPTRVWRASSRQRSVVKSVRWVHEHDHIRPRPPRTANGWSLVLVNSRSDNVCNMSRQVQGTYCQIYGGNLTTLECNFCGKATNNIPEWFGYDSWKCITLLHVLDSEYITNHCEGPCHPPCKHAQCVSSRSLPFQVEMTYKKLSAPRNNEWTHDTSPLSRAFFVKIPCW